MTTFAERTVGRIDAAHETMIDAMMITGGILHEVGIREEIEEGEAAVGLFEVLIEVLKGRLVLNEIGWIVIASTVTGTIIPATVITISTGVGILERIAR
mmetsp:Transcript_40082/g.78019  ORF Transcript_40082/g.78019 Transcript_40082/m.78019 type:complete len:99 (+) Transcript_40082:342-638(+)